MKWFLIIISILVIGALGLAAINFFYQQELVDFLIELGWNKLAGFASGGWWINIPTWILAIGVLGGLWFTWWQIFETRKSTNAQLAVELFTKIRDAEIKKLLRDIIYELSPEKIGNLSTTEKVAIGDLLDWFDMIGALIDKGIIDESCAIEVYGGGPAVLRCWYQLAGYIRTEQKVRGSYAENYEDFTYRTYKHYKNANIRIALHTKSIDNLLDEYDKSEFETLFPRSSKIIRKQRRNK